MPLFSHLLPEPHRTRHRRVERAILAVLVIATLAVLVAVELMRKEEQVTPLPQEHFPTRERAK